MDEGNQWGHVPALRCPECHTDLTEDDYYGLYDCPGCDRIWAWADTLEIRHH